MNSAAIEFVESGFGQMTIETYVILCAAEDLFLSTLTVPDIHSSSEVATLPLKKDLWENHFFQSEMLKYIHTIVDVSLLWKLNGKFCHVNSLLW